jgi:hypothetical protein
LLAGAVCAQNLDHLQPDHWITVGSNTIKSVLPSPLPYGSPAAIINAGVVESTIRSAIVIAFMVADTATMPATSGTVLISQA